MKFQCSDEQGAFVFTNVPADTGQMLPSLSLAQFIRNNIDRWHEYAQNTHDLLFTRDQIIFVSGVTKTEDWGLGAFVNQACGGEVAFTAQILFFQGAFSVRRQCAQMGNIQYCVKPLPDNADLTLSIPTSIEGQETSSTGTSMRVDGNPGELMVGTKQDQTLFLHYYKMKARWWSRRVFKATAGPDERDMDRLGDGEDIAIGLQMDNEEDVVREPPIDQVRSLTSPAEGYFAEADLQAYDPVDFLLDYILNYPMEVSASGLWAFGFTVLTSFVCAGWDGGTGGHRERPTYTCPFRESH